MEENSERMGMIEAPLDALQQHYLSETGIDMSWLSPPEIQFPSPIQRIVPIQSARPTSKVYDETIKWVIDHFDSTDGIDKDRLLKFCIRLENQ